MALQRSKRYRTLVLTGRGDAVYNTSTGALVQAAAPRVETYVGSEILDSAGHPWPPKRRKDPRDLMSNIGGPFMVRKNFYEAEVVSEVYAKSSNVNTTRIFNSKVWAPFTTNSSVLPLSDSSMAGWGTKGWNLYKPTHQRGQLGQAIAELRDFPKLPALLSLRDNARRAHSEADKYFRMRQRKISPASLGDEYLNWSFGWLPLYQDIKDLIHNIFKMEKRLQQLARDNGNWVRRRGSVSENSSFTETTVGTPTTWPFSPTTNLFLSGSASWKRQTYQIDKIWFSGAFRYWLGRRPDEIASMSVIPDRERFQLTRALFGLDPTDPSLYWELIPWTWLLDWVFPYGTIIDNLFNDSADNLVAAYAYVMHHNLIKITNISYAQLTTGQFLNATSSFTTEVKQRAVANPYGFGITWSGLSPTRLAILGALGMTRLND